MSARILHLQAKHYAHLDPLVDEEPEDDEFDDEGAFGELVPGERITTSGAGARGATMLSASIVIVIASGVGLAVANIPAAREFALTFAHATMSLALAPGAPPARLPPSEPPPQAAAAEAPAALKQSLPEVIVAQAPGAEGGAPVEPAETAAAPSETSVAAADPVEETSSASLPPVTFDAKDPLQKRAAAAGLDPNLSRALLSRLSPADFRNADHAIKTALAGSAQPDVFIWPKKPAPKLAQFEIRFVQGAPHDCRRYVVIVSKDRWSTTARPMEKCGVGLVGRGAKAAG